jgi:hypothetical protein
MADLSLQLAAAAGYSSWPHGKTGGGHLQVQGHCAQVRAGQDV